MVVVVAPRVVVVGCCCFYVVACWSKRRIPSGTFATGCDPRAGVCIQGKESEEVGPDLFSRDQLPRIPYPKKTEWHTPKESSFSKN